MSRLQQHTPSLAMCDINAAFVSSSYIFLISSHRRDRVESTATRLTQRSLDESMPKAWSNCKALKHRLALLSGIWIAIQGLAQDLDYMC